MTVYNYKLLEQESVDINNFFDDITSHEEQGWQFVSFNSAMDMSEGYGNGFSHIAFMRKPK